MRRCVAALAAVMGLSVVMVAPVGAQDSVLDLPPLGFEIARTSGFPGDVVLGQVDVGDVAERCTTVSELQGNVDSSLGMQGAQSTTVDAWLAQGPPEGFSAEDQELFGDVVETFGIGVLAQAETAETLWLATHVFAFGDIATEEILDASGTFDPFTGEGSITVPPLAPGTYALAAACVILQGQGALLDGGLNDGFASFMEWIEASGTEIPLVVDPLDDDWAEFVEASAFEWVPDIVDPRAIGIALFCVLNPDGTCPGADPGVDEPPTPLDPPPDVAPEPGPAPVADTSPRFTG